MKCSPVTPESAQAKPGAEITSKCSAPGMMLTDLIRLVVLAEEHAKGKDMNADNLMGIALLAAAEDTDPGDEVEALRQEENDERREGLMQELGSEPDPASSRY